MFLKKRLITSALIVLPPVALAGYFGSSIALANTDKTTLIDVDNHLHSEIANPHDNPQSTSDLSPTVKYASTEVVNEVQDKDSIEEHKDLANQTTEVQSGNDELTEIAGEAVSVSKPDAIVSEVLNKDAVEESKNLVNQTVEIQSNNGVLPEIAGEVVPKSNDLTTEVPNQNSIKELKTDTTKPDNDPLSKTEPLPTEGKVPNKVKKTSDLGDETIQHIDEILSKPISANEVSDKEKSKSFKPSDLGDLGDETVKPVSKIETQSLSESCVPTAIDNRYTDNGNGTIVDNTTCLIWLKDTDCLGKHNWDEAFAVIDELNIGKNFNCDDYIAATFNDWRLPTIQELQSVVHYGFYNPVISNAEGTIKWGEMPATDAFTSVKWDGYYWSSTPSALAKTRAWNINLNDGNTNSSEKARSNNYVWPVRAGQLYTK